MKCWRGPVGVSFRHCMRCTAVPTLAATVIALLMHQASRPRWLDADTAAAATPWLTLPLFATALACSLAAAWLWPVFALRRPGAELIRRLDRGPVGGRGAVIVGALLAQLVVSLPLLAWLPGAFGAPAYARRHHHPTGPRDPVLDQQGATLRYRLQSPATVTAIWLRPRAALPTGPDATAVALTCDGEPLATTPIAFAGTLELVRVAIPPRRLDHFELTRTDGDVPLLFADDSVVAVGPADVPTAWNGAFVAALACTTTAATLGLAALLGLGAGAATLATAIASAQFVQWVAGVGPIADALLALLRGVVAW